MSAEPVREVGAAGRVAVLACFDDTATAVFATLCRLTAGDAARATELLVETYAYLERTAAREAHVTVDLEWMLAAAHSVYAATATSPTAGETLPVSALSPVERVVVDMHLVGGRSVAQIALLLGLGEHDISAALAAGGTRLDVAGSGEPADALRRGEVWLDDATRGSARIAIEAGRPLSVGAVSTTALPSRADVAGDPFVARTVLPTRLAAEPFALEPEFVRPRRSRSVTIGAVLGLGAVIAGLAVWVSPSTEHSEAEPSTTRPSIIGPSTTAAETSVPETSVPVTTGPATTGPPTTEPDTGGVPDGAGDAVDQAVVVRPGFILAPIPAGLIGTGAGVNLDQELATNWFELWASADAARTAGRWFAILVADGANYPPPGTLSTDAIRAAIGESEALISSTPDGVRRADVDLPGGQRVEYESYGFTDEELIRLIASATYAPDNRPSYSNDARNLFDGLDVRTARLTRQPLLDLVAIVGLNDLARSNYQAADNRTYVTLLAETQVENDLLIAQLLTSASTDPAAAYAPGRTITVRDRTMYTGQLDSSRFFGSSDDHPFQFIEWHQGDRTVMAVGAVGLDLLISVATAARPATDDEWSRLSSTPSIIIDQPVEEVTPMAFTAQIGNNSGTNGHSYAVSLSDADGGTVSLDVQRPADPASTGSSQIVNYSSSAIVHVDPDHPLVELNSIGATVVLVLFDGRPAAASLGITVNGREHDVSIVHVGKSSLWGAAYVFDEHTEYNAVLVDAGGDIIATLAG